MLKNIQNEDGTWSQVEVPDESAPVTVPTYGGSEIGSIPKTEATYADTIAPAIAPASAPLRKGAGATGSWEAPATTGVAPSVAKEEEVKVKIKTEDASRSPSSAPAPSPDLALTGKNVQGMDANSVSAIQEESRKVQRGMKAEADATQRLSEITRGLNIAAGEEAITKLAPINKAITQMADIEKEEQAQFLKEYSDALQRFNAMPPPQKKTWWEITSTGEKLGALTATFLGSVLQYKTGNDAALKGVLNSIDQRVSDDIEAQKAKYLKEKDILASRKDLNDLRASVFRNSIGAMEAKKQIVLEDLKKKAEQAIMADDRIPQAEKEARIAKVNQTVAVQQMETLAKVANTSQSAYSVPKPETGRMSPKETLEYIKLTKDTLGTNVPTSPASTYIATETMDKMLDSIRDAKSPEEKAAATVTLGEFISKTMAQGSFTPNMTDVLLPTNLKSKAKGALQWALSNPQGTITDEQLSALKSFTKLKMSAMGATAREIESARQDLSSMGIPPERAGLAIDLKKQMEFTGTQTSKRQ